MNIYQPVKVWTRAYFGLSLIFNDRNFLHESNESVVVFNKLLFVAYYLQRVRAMTITPQEVQAKIDKYYPQSNTPEVNYLRKIIKLPVLFDPQIQLTAKVKVARALKLNLIHMLADMWVGYNENTFNRFLALYQQLGSNSAIISELDWVVIDCLLDSIERMSRFARLEKIYASQVLSWHCKRTIVETVLNKHVHSIPQLTFVLSLLKINANLDLTLSKIKQFYSSISSITNDDQVMKKIFQKQGLCLLSRFINLAFNEDVLLKIDPLKKELLSSSLENACLMIQSIDRTHSRLSLAEGVILGELLEMFDTLQNSRTTFQRITAALPHLNQLTSRLNGKIELALGQADQVSQHRLSAEASLLEIAGYNIPISRNKAVKIVKSMCTTISKSPGFVILNEAPIILTLVSLCMRCNLQQLAQGMALQFFKHPNVIRQHYRLAGLIGLMRILHSGEKDPQIVVRVSSLQEISQMKWILKEKTREILRGNLTQRQRIDVLEWDTTAIQNGLQF